ncbi:MAG: hypothetical protein ABIG94_08465 [Pseudomonadota bacterium]
MVSWAAVLLVSTLSVVGCMGQYPGMSPYGYGGGYDLGYGGIGGGASQPYYSPQPYQPYYQSQPYVYSGNGGVYVYQPDQVVTPGPEGTTAAPPGPWLDRRHQRQEDRIRHTWNSGRLSPEEYRRLEREQARRRGTDARLRADGNLSPQDRARLNPMQSRSGRPINQLTNQGAQPGPHGQLRPHGQLQPNAPPGTTAPTRATMQPGPMAPARPVMQARPAAPPRPAAQARPAAQPRATSSRPPGNGAAAP